MIAPKSNLDALPRRLSQSIAVMLVLVDRRREAGVAVDSALATLVDLAADVRRFVSGDVDDALIARWS